MEPICPKCGSTRAVRILRDANGVWFSCMEEDCPSNQTPFLPQPTPIIDRGFYLDYVGLEPPRVLEKSQQLEF